MLLLTLLCAVSPLWAAAPHAGFQQWLRQAAEAEDFHILHWDSRDLDRDGEADDALAWLCDARPGAGFNMWLVYEVDGERGVVERDTGGAPHARNCRAPSPDPPPFEETHLEGLIYDEESEKFDPEGIDRRAGLMLGRYDRWATGGPVDSRIVLEVVDGALEVTRTDVRGSPSALRGGTDWLRRVYRYDGAEGVDAREHAVIVVSPDLTEQPTRQWVLSGALEGPHDASFSVTAVEPSDGVVDVAVRITDDVRTPEDRLELWWLEDQEIVTLTISWLGPGDRLDVQRRGARPDAPMPRVSQLADGAVVVRLPQGRRYEHEAIRSSAEGGRALTVVYDDVDVPNGRHTRVATSDREPTGGENFSRILRLPGLHPFPSYKMREDMRIHTSRRLEPGETRLRSAP